MKAFQVLFILGGIFLTISLFLIYPSAPISETKSITIPPGNTYYYYLAYQVYKGGRLSGAFSETSGHSVNVYVFSEQQYNTYQTQLTPQGLYSTTGSSGTYSASLSTPGKYYIVLSHGVGFEQTSQSVSVTVNLDGYNTLILGLGISTVIATVVMFATGYVLKKKDRAKSPAPTASDVILFDQPKPQGS